MIQCHNCGWTQPLYICGECLIPLAIPVAEDLDELLQMMLDKAQHGTPARKAAAIAAEETARQRANPLDPWANP